MRGDAAALKAAEAWAAAFKAFWAFKGVTSIASLEAHRVLDTAEKRLVAALHSRHAICTKGGGRG